MLGTGMSLLTYFAVQFVGLESKKNIKVYI